MLKETLIFAAIQSGVLFLALWGIFQLVPSFPANAKAWLWRLAFLKPLLSLLPFAVVTLPILPAKQPVQVVGTEYGYAIEPVTVASVPLTSPAPQAIQIDPLLLAWCIGVIAVAGHAAWGMRRALKIAKSARAVSDERLLAWFDELLERARIHRHPALLTSDAISGAMLVGGKRYAVVLPGQAEHEDLRLMMAHEVAHIKRQDLFWFGVASTVQSLFFFNPMVWIAARCSRLDHESATDRDASHLAGVPIQKYADMLLRATTVARPSLAPGVLPVAESYRTIHRRLEAMKHFNSKPTFWRRTAIAALAMLTLGMLPAYNIVAAAWPVEGTEQLNSPDVSDEAFALSPVASSDQDEKARRAEAARQAKRLKIQRELSRLKAKEASLKKMQAELERKSKLTGQTAALRQVKGQVLKIQQATASTKALITKPITVVTTEGIKASAIQGKPATTVVAKEVKLLDGRKFLVASTTDVQVVPVVIGKDGKPTSTFAPQNTEGYTIFQWSPAEKRYIAQAPKTTHVVEGGKVQWKVQDTSKGSRIWKTVEVEGVPAQGSTQYMVTGKNVTITMKDGVYFISADGPISIRAVGQIKGSTMVPQRIDPTNIKADPINVPIKPIESKLAVQGVDPIRTNVSVGSIKASFIAVDPAKSVTTRAPITVTTMEPIKTSITIGGKVEQGMNPLQRQTLKGGKNVVTVGSISVKTVTNPIKSSTSVGQKINTTTKIDPLRGKKEEKKKKTPPAIDPAIFPPN